MVIEIELDGRRLMIHVVSSREKYHWSTSSPS